MEGLVIVNCFDWHFRFFDLGLFGGFKNFCDEGTSRWAILPPSDLSSFIDFFYFKFIDKISLNWKRYICEWWNKKSMKLNKSLGGRIAHLEVPSSGNFLNPPNKLKSKKRECQSKQFISTRPSMRWFFEWWNKKSMKLNKSLGGRIAHLEVPSSRKFLNPPNELKSKKRECQSKQFIIRRPSMRGFFDWWKYVSVWSISHFGLFSFLVL